MTVLRVRGEEPRRMRLDVARGYSKDMLEKLERWVGELEGENQPRVHEYGYGELEKMVVVMKRGMRLGPLESVGARQMVVFNVVFDVVVVVAVVALDARAARSVVRAGGKVTCRVLVEISGVHQTTLVCPTRARSE